MKHLLNLRTPAIAVEIGPYKSLEFSSMGLNGKTVPMLMVYGGKNTHAVQIPEGEWKILGRANELSHSDCFQLVENNGWGCLLNYGPDATPDNKYTFTDEKASWQSYCTENGLTNQLILIQEK